MNRFWAVAVAVASWSGTLRAEETDPFIWLEDVSGDRAMAWVKAENAKTADVLEKHPRFAGLYADALALAEDKDRLPTPAFRGGSIYNLWQDAEHVRGIWRRTSLAGYKTPAPPWETVLDLDQLAAAEHANWFWHGANCYLPDERICLVSLSDGGEDATTEREFDLASGKFVQGGFTLPKSKQTVAWTGPDELLVSREWGPGTMTASGYPFVVKSLKRGQPLDAAVEVYRGKESDVSVQPATLVDGDGHRATIIVRGITFFENETWLVTASGPVKLALPAKSNVQTLVAGRLLISLDQDWIASGRKFAQGSLVSLALDAVAAHPAQLEPELVYSPGPRESLGDVTATRTRLIVSHYENVKGRAAVYSPIEGGKWSRQPLPLPDLASIDVVAADSRSEQAFVSVRSFLIPTSYWLVDAATAHQEVARQLPAKFDASGLTVDQHEAKSRDGTRIPYFVVRPKALKLNGQNPTILNAYGGFQIAQTPFYSASYGKLWLTQGGVYVLANIRGGGEFGPAWHEAGLKTHRQLIFDDFAAVGRDLIKRKITSPRRLGIVGGSNGGLLMGVEFVQHPELWNAVQIAVPLLDMLRYEQIAAGASWVGEYGSVSVPEERAFLASISPYHTVKKGARYPLPFIWTTTKDDRVGPQHARKFAARLQSLGIPYQYYEVIEGGHAAGANLKEQAHTTALGLTYFTRQLKD
jgi:prolyl oligopeptidase